MAQDHNHLLTQFSSTIGSLTNNNWGFVVVRTAYADVEATDAAQWSVVLAKLQEYALPMIKPDTFALPVIADLTLKGASYDAVRITFNAWVSNYQQEHKWVSDIRQDCCLVIDSLALASLLKAPKVKQRSLEPWVVAVDAKEPATIPYKGWGPYLGWTRVAVYCLEDLFEDIDIQSLEEICPVRIYDGQLPLIDSTPGGRMIDPEGGVNGRYKFPQGTPRGIVRGKAMLADIEKALGSQAVTQTVDGGGRVGQRGSAP